MNPVQYLRHNLFLLVIIIPAWILTLLPIIFDGQHGCVNGTCGFIVGTNYRDGLWFQAVAAASFNTFPFQVPSFAGEILKAYHFLPNLLAFGLSKLGIPIAVTIYKIIPLLFISGLTLVSISLARKIKDSPVFVGIFLFFTYFGMHLSLITSLYHFGEIRNSVLINTFQATRLLESPHAALAMLLLYSTLIILLKKKRSLKDTLLVSVMIFLATGTKFYVAFSMVTIIGLYELLSLVTKKVKLSLFFSRIGLYSLGGLLGIFLFYDIFNAASSGSIFIFSPFATVHHLIESNDLFYNESMIHARYFLYDAGWSPRLLLIELYSTALFVLFYFGSRVIGFFHIAKALITRRITQFELSVTISVLLSIILSVLFIQKGDWFNPIQFAVPAAYLMTIFASKFLYDIWENKRLWGSFMLIIVVLITFPANMANASYLTNPGRFVINNQELEALMYLKSQPEGVVFQPIDENDMPYVTAFTGKPSYINYTNGLRNEGIDIEERFNIATERQELLADETIITYLYLPKNHQDFSKLNPLCLGENFSEIFSNEGVVICKRK